MTTLKYTAEFPDFDPATMPAIPATWVDQSWHNDGCPCFNAGNGKLVYVDYVDPAQREIDDCERFSVHSDPEHADSCDVLFASDDWAALLAFVAEGR